VTLQVAPLHQGAVQAVHAATVQEGAIKQCFVSSAQIYSSATEKRLLFQNKF